MKPTIALYIVLIAVMSSFVHAHNSTARGLFGGAASGALFGGLIGGGRGAGIGAGVGAATGVLIGSAKDAERRSNYDYDYYAGNTYDDYDDYGSYDDNYVGVGVYGGGYYGPGYDYDYDRGRGNYGDYGRGFRRGSRGRR